MPRLELMVMNRKALSRGEIVKGRCRGWMAISKSFTPIRKSQVKRIVDTATANWDGNNIRAFVYRSRRGK